MHLLKLKIVFCFLLIQGYLYAQMPVTLNYKFRMESIGYNNLGGIMAGDTLDLSHYFFRQKSVSENRFTLNCNVNLTTQRQPYSTIKVILTLKDIDLSFSQNNIAYSPSQLIEELKTPVLVHYDTNGTPDSVRIHEGLSFSAKNILKDIIGQFIFKGDWEKNNTSIIPETNITGKYLARYDFIKDSLGFRCFRKTNTGYSTTFTFNPKEKIIPESFTLIWFNPHGYVYRLLHSSGETTLLNKDTISLTANRFTALLQSMHFEKKKGAFPKIEESLNFQQYETIGNNLSSKKITEMAYNKTLGEQTWKSLKIKLMNCNMLTNNERDTLKLQLRSLVYLQPATTDSIFAELIVTCCDSLKSDIILWALAHCNSTKAIDILTQYLKEKEDEKAVLLNYLPYLGLTTTPTLQSIKLLKAFSFEEFQPADVKSVAQLALGGTVLHFQEIKPDIADDLIDYLLSKMSVINDTLQQVLILGNSGNSKILPYLESIFKNPLCNLYFKKAAVYATRFIKQDAIETILHELAENKTLGLDETAKEVLQFRKLHLMN